MNTPWVPWGPTTSEHFFPFYTIKDGVFSLLWRIPGTLIESDTPIWKLVQEMRDQQWLSEQRYILLRAHLFFPFQWRGFELMISQSRTPEEDIELASWFQFPLIHQKRYRELFQRQSSLTLEEAHELTEAIDRFPWAETMSYRDGLSEF